jgi:hypothetical protein
MAISPASIVGSILLDVTIESETPFCRENTAKERRVIDPTASIRSLSRFLKLMN